jgi:hypothetical protein
MQPSSNGLSRCFLFITILFSTAPAFDEIDIPLLPRDENEARILLNEGALDPALWRRVEPFYTAPLCVPAGELAILQDLFFSLPDDLPAGETALSKYLPWDNAARERLFADYPELLPFKPVLSFENSGLGRAPGEMAFSFSKPPGSDTMRQYAQFSVGRERSFARAEGRVDFTDAYGRWHRRGVTVSPGRACRFSVGNFDAGDDGRLFSGYFPAPRETDTTISGNWLYGASPSWNGAFFSAGAAPDRKKGRPGIAGKAFMHAGPTERMAHGECAAGLGGPVSFRSGVSYLETLDSAARILEETGYFQCGLSFVSKDGWHCGLQSGFDIRQPGFVPFDLTCSHRGKRSGLNAALTVLPHGFYAPRGALAHYITDKTGLGDTADDYATAVDVRFTHSQSSLFAWTPRMTAIFAGEALRYLNAEIGASGRWLFGYRVLYSWSPLYRPEARTKVRRQGLFEFSFPVSRAIHFETVNRFTGMSDGYWRYSGTVAPCIEVGRVLRIAPLVALSASGTRPLEKTAGIRQTLRFTDKTRSEVKIEKQFPAGNGTGLSAQGRMSFLF